MRTKTVVDVYGGTDKRVYLGEMGYAKKLWFPEKTVPKYWNLKI